MTGGSAVAGAGEGFAPDSAFLECVHCGLCLQSCPTYLELGREADSPRGRLYLMRALSEGRVPLDREALGHLDLCLGCRSCDSACPSGVRYGLILERARAWVAEDRRRPGGTWLRRQLIERSFTSPARLSLFMRLLRLAERARVLALARRVAPRQSVLAYFLSLLPMPLQPTARLPRRLPAVGPERGSVAFLEGCVMPALFPQTNYNTVTLLARAGLSVAVPKGQGCCGALSLHTGNERGALTLARRNVAAFSEAAADYVVTNAAGCGAVLKQYGDLLAHDERFSEAARSLSAKVRDIHEILADFDLRLPAVAPTRIAYHDPCHLAHAQGIRGQPRRLLRGIAGVEIVELDEAEICCGSAGDYNLLQPAMARRLLARKTAAIRRANASVVAAPNPGCILQIAAGLRLDGIPLPVKHTVDILAEACRNGRIDGRGT